MRANCYIALNDLFKAVGDVRPLTKLIPDNTAAYLKLSHLYYAMGEADTSLTYVIFAVIHQLCCIRLYAVVRNV